MLKAFGYVCGLLFMFCLFSAKRIVADDIVVGDLEFNAFSEGVNDFTVNNFTGINNLGFFPVDNNVTFQNVVLTATESDGTILVFSVGDLDPGTDTSSQVPSDLHFSQVVFSAVLSPSSFSLTNGSSGLFTADPKVSFTLLPSSGAYLIAGTDLGVLVASGSPNTTVPEPSTLLLLVTSLIGIVVLTNKKSAS
jgi:hypothetical protein